MAKIHKYQIDLVETHQRYVSITIIVVFLLLSCWYLNSPGLNFDECLGAAPAVNFLVGSKTEPMQINPSIIHIFGQPLPVMIMPYIGPIKTLLHIPFYALFGISVVTTRLAPVICVALAIFIFYFAIRRLDGERTAFLSCLLMAVHPAMTIYATRDITPVAFAILMLAAIFYFLSRWLERPKLVYLFLLSFCCGLGVSHKVDFLFLAVGLAISMAAIYKIKPTPKETLFVLLAFGLGALPIIIFSLLTGFMTLSTAKTEFNVSNMPFAFLTRLFQLGDLFSTRPIITYFTGDNSWFPIIIGLTVVVVVISYFFPSGDVSPIRLYLSHFNSFIILSMGLFVMLSSLTQFSLQFHHLLAITPLACIFLAKSKWQKLTIIIAFLLAEASVELNSDLKKTGGVGIWSSTINKLNADLLQQQRRIGDTSVSVNLRSHGFTNSLIVLSKGRLNMRRVYAGEEPDPNGFNLYRPGIKYNTDNVVKIYHDSQPRVFAVLTD